MRLRRAIEAAGNEISAAHEGAQACALASGGSYRNNGAIARIIEMIGQADTPTITPKTAASAKKCRFVSLAM